MIEFGFGRRFHDLIYFEVGIFFIFFELTIYLRASSQKFVENHQFNVILSYLKQLFLDIHLFNVTYLHTTCTVF